MQAYKIEAVVPQSGTIEIDLQEFRLGEMVQIIVLGEENGTGANGHMIASKRIDTKEAKKKATLQAIRDGKYKHL